VPLLRHFRLDFLPQLYGVTKTEISLSLIIHGWWASIGLQVADSLKFKGDKSRATVAEYYASLSGLEQVVFGIIYVSGFTTF
jgi:hypothetical protein